MANVKIVKLSEIEPDLLNANRHTERGNAMLRRSMEQFGFAEAGTLDKHNRIIGGNHRTEVSADVLAADEAIVIEIDGKQPVYIKRNDLDLSSEEGRRLSYYLNRSAQVSIDFDPGRILADLDTGMDLSDLFSEGELSDILKGVDIPPNFNTGAKALNDQFMVIIECETEQDQVAVLEDLTVQGYKCKALIS